MQLLLAHGVTLEQGAELRRHLVCGSTAGTAISYVGMGAAAMGLVSVIEGRV